jgi:hypothetical protein
MYVSFNELEALRPMPGNSCTRGYQREDMNFVKTDVRDLDPGDCKAGKSPQQSCGLGMESAG